MGKLKNQDGLDQEELMDDDDDDDQKDEDMMNQFEDEIDESCLDDEHIS